MEKILLTSTSTQELVQPLLWFSYYFLAKWVGEGIKSIINNKKGKTSILYFIIITVGILMFFAQYTYVSSIILGGTTLAHEILWSENKYAASIVFLLLGITLAFSLLVTAILHKIMLMFFILLALIVIRYEKRISFVIGVVSSSKS